MVGLWDFEPQRYKNIALKMLLYVLAALPSVGLFCGLLPALTSYFYLRYFLTVCGYTLLGFLWISVVPYLSFKYLLTDFEQPDSQK